MKRFLLIALAGATACGAETVRATPEIKAAVAQAGSSMTQVDRSTDAALSIVNIGSSAAIGLSSGGGVNLARLPLPGEGGVATGIILTPQTAVAPAGCLRPAGSFNSLVPAGTGGCTASDHLELDFADGEVANVTWTGVKTNFAVSVTVVAGAWSGTSLQAAIGHVSGTVRLEAAAGGMGVDADVDWNRVILDVRSTDPNSGVGTSSTIQLDGETTDRAASARFVSHFILDKNGTSGSTQLDLLDQSGKELHSVAWNDVAVDAKTAGGGLLYDGKQVASLIRDGSGLQTAWTDGTSDTFDADVWLPAPRF